MSVVPVGGLLLADFSDAGGNLDQQESAQTVRNAAVGESELDDGKLPALLELKYGTPIDAVRELGSVAEIRSTFLGFQHGLYES